MYMKYTLSDFRERLREAFNYVETGNEVLIERYGKTYELKLVKKDYSSYKLPEHIVDPSRLGRANNIETYNDGEPRVVPEEGA